MEHTCCDLCGAGDGEVLYGGASWRQTLEAPVSLVRCRRCGLMYMDPRPGPAEIGQYYPDSYAAYRPAIEDEPFFLMRYMRRSKLAGRRALVERYDGRRAGRILDVGCATGLFLHEMTLAGWTANGVEPSGPAAAYGRQRFGLDIYQGMLEDAPYPGGSFDCITFWDVLEHTFSPAETLRRATHLLRPGGLLVANVPNWDSDERRLFGPYWAGLDPPRHLYVFTRRTLTALLEQAGFESLAWVSFMPGYFSFAISLERAVRARSALLGRILVRLLSIPGMRLFYEPYSVLANRARRGSTVTVFARRT